MAQARSQRNNILAGAFVLITVALGVFIIILISNVWERFGSKSVYYVDFSLIDGAEGLEPGAAVKVGGMRVGQVKRTRFVFDPATGEPVSIEVAIEIDSDIRLHSDADVQLQRPLLGSGSTINISAVPLYRPPELSPVGPPARLREGGRLVGRIGAPGFLSPADYTKIQDTIDRVNRIVAGIEPRIEPIMDDAEGAVANVRAITDDARRQWPVWSEDIAAVLDRFEQAAQRVPSIVESFEAGVQQGRDFVASAQRTLDDNRPRIDEAVENIRELTRKAQGEGYDRFMQAVEAGRAGLESFASAARAADDLMMRKSPELSETVTAALLAAQQLKLATVEVRASPWRLLYQPSKKELENELLYNSVRTYSESVTQLRAASEALRAAAERAAEPGGSRIDQSVLDALTAQLREAFANYERAERAFLDRWVQTRP